MFQGINYIYLSINQFSINFGPLLMFASHFKVIWYGEIHIIRYLDSLECDVLQFGCIGM